MSRFVRAAGLAAAGLGDNRVTWSSTSITTASATGSTCILIGYLLHRSYTGKRTVPGATVEISSGNYAHAVVGGIACG